MQLFHDYVIIGAGAAGCVLAARLSDDPTASVLLIEAGPAADDDQIRNPDRWAELAGSRYDWAYRTQAQRHLGGRGLSWPRGRVTGGSTAMNAMVYLRGMPGSYAQWARIAGDGWSYSAMTPFFQVVEHGPDEHGVGLRITRIGEGHPWCEAFITAVSDLGHAFNADLDHNGAGGVGYYSVTRTAEGRQWAAQAYLAAVTGRPNLAIEPLARALRIEVAGDRATGASYVASDGSLRMAHAGTELILAAGVIGSPHLLLLSGIGPADDLREHGLPVVVDLPGVGRNLHDHLAVSVRYPSASPDPAHTGAGLADVGLFVPGDDGGQADLHLWLAPSPGADDYSFTIAAGITQPESRGYLTLASPEPEDAPLIQPAYLECEKDLKVLVGGLRLVEEIAAAKAIRSLRAEPLAQWSHTATQSPDEFVRANASTSFHPVGTCRMGSDDMAVVDSDLRVRGLENVRVVDASVIPLITTGGTGPYLRDCRKGGGAYQRSIARRASLSADDREARHEIRLFLDVRRQSCLVQDMRSSARRKRAMFLRYSIPGRSPDLLMTIRRASGRSGSSSARSSRHSA